MPLNKKNILSTLFLAALPLALLLAAACSKHAPGNQLTVILGGSPHVYTRKDLLKNPATREITVLKDPVYGTMHYQALPLSALLQGAKILPGQVIQTVATDGFTAYLPLDLVMRKPGDKGAVPYVAIEPPAHPWPHITGKKFSAGPFYVVWLNPAADDIRTEQWPYGTVTLRAVDSPVNRWPALAIDSKLPLTSPVRAGQALFVTNCLTCHRLNGAGDSDVGPDLNLPMNPTEYFRPGILHAYIRNPASIRHWKTMWMKSFSKDTLSDREIDQIIAYLGYMAKHKVSMGSE